MEERDRGWAAPRPLFYVSVGDSGVSLSWKSAVGLLALAAAAVGLFNKLALKADIEEHSRQEHSVTLEDRKEPARLRALAAEHHRALADVREFAEEQRRQGKSLDTLRTAVFEDRADDLAEEAAALARPRARKGVREHVKATALENQRRGRPIRSGLDAYLER